MKKLALPILLFVFSSCSTIVWRPYQKDFDDYKKVERVTYRMLIHPSERIHGNNIADIVLERNYSRKVDSTIIFWKIISSEPKLPLDNKSYIRINNETFELRNRSLKHSTSLETETYYSSILLSDSTSIGSLYPKTKTSTKHYDMFITPLPNDVLQKLKSGVKVEIRVYFGNQPYTFKLRKNNLKKVKRLLSELDKY